MSIMGSKHASDLPWMDNKQSYPCFRVSHSAKAICYTLILKKIAWNKSSQYFCSQNIQKCGKQMEHGLLKLPGKYNIIIDLEVRKHQRVGP